MIATDSLLSCTDLLFYLAFLPALIAVSHLSTRNITESSVTLFWTPPVVQYNTYRITFISEVIKCLYWYKLLSQTHLYLTDALSIHLFL